MNKKSNLRHTPTKGLYGQITHTELSSKDPKATREWCSKVLGWNFMAEVPTPAGEYHLFSYAEKAGEGIRSTGEGKTPGTTPFVHVANTDEAFEKALSEGAEVVAQPETQMPSVRTTLVRAPGGVWIGFSGPSKPEK